MTNPNCPICHGIGWVCENHPEKAWDKEIGCDCGAGMPCECVRANGLEEPDVSWVLSENPRQTHWQRVPPADSYSILANFGNVGAVSVIPPPRLGLCIHWRNHALGGVEQWKPVLSVRTKAIAIR
jgi:hypothetical protein